MATEVKPETKPLTSDDKIAQDLLVAKEKTKLARGERLQKPQGVQKNSRLLWEYIIPVIALHLLIPLAFFSYFFSWWGVLWLFVGNYIFTSLGIGAGYHRLLTHRGFKCPKWFEYTLATLGVCSFQDSPGRWVLVHRVHHQYSDHRPDPHTPRVSAFWSHMGWLFIDNKELSNASAYDRYVRDLMQDRYYMWLQKGQNWILVYFIHALVIWGVGSLVGFLMTGTGAGALQIGLQWLMWGVVMRTIWTWHVTWAINSAAHIWGYRNYVTKDNSRNLWWVALLTYGEGWHNNHHAYPSMAKHGHRWWEIDMTFAVIRLMQKLGLAWHVVDYKQRRGE